MTAMLTVSQQYMLASRAKSKLLSAANKNSGKDHDLRVLVGHANLLDRLSSAVSQFDELVPRSSPSYYYNEEEDDEDYSDSDSDEEQEEYHSAVPKYQHVSHTYVTSSDSESDSESDSDSELSTNSDSSSSDSISDYDESNVRSKYLENLQDLQDDSDDVDQEYVLSSQPALYKCPSQNLTLSSISLNLSSSKVREHEDDQPLVTTVVLSDEDSDNELEEDLGTLSPVYVL